VVHPPSNLAEPDRPDHLLLPGAEQRLERSTIPDPVRRAETSDSPCCSRFERRPQWGRIIRDATMRDGRTNFSELQALAGGHQRDMIFYAFDLLYLEGYDLRDTPQIERKRSQRTKRMFLTLSRYPGL
jgi:hypothetical protein